MPIWPHRQRKHFPPLRHSAVCRRRRRRRSTIFEIESLLERTAEKLRYLRLSTATRKGRSKRSSQTTTSSHLQSPVSNESRSSTSSATNAGKRRSETKFRLKYLRNQERTTDCFSSAACYLTTNNDHDDEDFEEEPIKLST